MTMLFPEIEHRADARSRRCARTRNGALIGRDLATARGWKVGDRVPLRSNVWMRKDGAQDWQFEIVGIYGFADGKFPTERASGSTTTTSTKRARSATARSRSYFARIADPGSAAADLGEHRRAVRELDVTRRRRRTSAIGSRGADQPDRRHRVLRQRRSSLAVLFTLLFLTGNTMMQSVRERIPELAVLKTYGFSNGAVDEPRVRRSAPAVRARGRASGSARGRGVRRAIYRLHRRRRPVAAVERGRASAPALAVIVAVVSALPPARRVQTLNIVDALAGR